MYSIVRMRKCLTHAYKKKGYINNNNNNNNNNIKPLKHNNIIFILLS